MSGRDELGFPKLFSNIDVSRDGKCWKATLSWREQKWAELELGDLQSDTSMDEHVPTKVQDLGDGFFVHKYFPASGSKQRGQPDAEYDVFLPNQPETSSLQSRRIASPSKIRLDFKTFDDWRDMPTLHPIINRLAEIPVFEFIEGAESTHKGVPDFSNAQRLK